MAHENPRRDPSLSTASQGQAVDGRVWRWRIDCTVYDCSSQLTRSERSTLDHLIARFDAKKMVWPRGYAASLDRLVRPIKDVLVLTNAGAFPRGELVRLLLREMQFRQTTFWAWSEATWCDIIKADTPVTRGTARRWDECRQHTLALSYLLCNFTALHAVEPYQRHTLAAKVFGQTAVETAVQRVTQELVGWG